MTSSKGRDQIERNFYCGIDIGSQHHLEATAHRPMRATLGWMRETLTPEIEAKSEAYRHFVQQLHAWLTRTGSKADFKFERPLLDNPQITSAAVLAVGLGLPILLFASYALVIDRQQLARTLGLPPFALTILGAGVLLLSWWAAITGAIRLQGWLGRGWERPRHYEPARLPEGSLPPSATPR